MSSKVLDHFITICPRLRQLRIDYIRYFTPYDWKVNELLQFSFTPVTYDLLLERKNDLVYGNLQYLNLNYSTNDSS